MTCNLSHRTFFPVNPSEDKLVSSLKDRYVIGGMSEKNGGAYGKPQCFEWEFANSFDYGKDGVDRGGSFESVTTDIIDLLPSDPFGMEISATFTAWAGLVGDFESDGLNFMWNRTLMFQTEPGKMEVYERSNLASGYDSSKMGGCKSASHQEESALSCGADKFCSLKNEDVHITDHAYKECGQGTDICRGGDEGAPNDALLFALDHLSLRDLLSAEKVCKSLRSAIQNDVLLWKNIHIDQSLSAKINDDALLRLTNRAQGNLLCLSMVGCWKITDDGLNRVLQSNPRLTKLNVAGCTGLSDDGIVNNLKAFKSSSAGTLGINHLRIGSRYGITREHFEEIKCLVGTNNCNEPRYYHYGNSLPRDDDRAIDIEICPKCENSRLVYDCPAKSCQGKQQQEMCRGCIICIARCVECGRCVNDSEYEETFCLDVLCSECWKKLRSLQERQDEKGGALYSEHAIFHCETTRYSIQLRG